MFIDNFFRFTLGMSFIILSVIGIVSIILYVIKSVSIMLYIKNNGGENTIFAWIPFLDIYAFTNTIYRRNDYIRSDLLKMDIPKWVYEWYPILIIIASTILGMIFIPNGIISIIHIIASIIIFGQLYQDAMIGYNVRVSMVERIIVSIFPVVGYIKMIYMYMLINNYN